MGGNTIVQQSVQGYVCLTRFWRRHGSPKPGQEGVLVRGDHSHIPYHVRAPNGRTWWYRQNEIRSCHGVERHHVRQHHHYRPTVGSRVCLTRFWRRHGSLKPGQEGVLLRDDHSHIPYRVRAPNGRTWWYYQNEIRSCHGAERHNVGQHEIVHHRRTSHHHRPNAHHRLTVGSRVCLTRFWRRQGPLKPGQEGVLVRDAHDYQPYYVQASNGRRWWYFKNEIMPCHGIERPNAWQHGIVHHRRPNAHHRPTVGSRVCLTRFWRRQGPLKPGQEGVLVRDAHDYQPYYVQASNGRR